MRTHRESHLMPISFLDLTVEKNFSFVTGNFDNVAQLLFNIKRTVGQINISFRLIKSTGKYEILFGKNEGITFPSEEIPSIVVLQEFQIIMVYILGTK